MVEPDSVLVGASEYLRTHAEASNGYSIVGVSRGPDCLYAFVRFDPGRLAEPLTQCVYFFETVSLVDPDSCALNGIDVIVGNLIADIEEYPYIRHMGARRAIGIWVAWPGHLMWRKDSSPTD